MPARDHLSAASAAFVVALAPPMSPGCWLVSPSHASRATDGRSPRAPGPRRAADPGRGPQGRRRRRPRSLGQNTRDNGGQARLPASQQRRVGRPRNSSSGGKRGVIILFFSGFSSCGGRSMMALRQFPHHVSTTKVSLTNLKHVALTLQPARSTRHISAMATLRITLPFGVLGALWTVTNISYAGMRAQNDPGMSTHRAIAFMFGFSFSVITLIAVDKGSNRAYGVRLPKAEAFSKHCGCCHRKRRPCDCVCCANSDSESVRRDTSTVTPLADRAGNM